jgi:hypothetical protein
MAVRFFSWQFLVIVLAVGFIGSIGVAILYEVKRDDWTVPDMKAMRAYRGSLMSDDQIRKLNAEAIADANRYKKIDQEARQKEFQEIAATAQHCSDIVYRERNFLECSRGLPLGLTYMDPRLTPTADQILEESLLGVCRFMHTKQEARLNKCLPPASN